MSAIAAATASIDTPERQGKAFSIPVAAATLIPAGVLVAEDASGNAVNASDAAAIRVVGRCEQDADNSAGSAGDIIAIVKEGTFKFLNSADHALAAADKGTICFVESNQAVAKTSTNKCKAGLVVDVESDGVWVDTKYAHLATQVVSQTQDALTDPTGGTASVSNTLVAIGATNSGDVSGVIKNNFATLAVENGKVKADVAALIAALQANGVLK